MDEAQKFAVETHMDELCDVIISDLFLPHLQIKGVLKLSERELICCESTNISKVLKTFRIITAKVDSWEATIEFLQKNNYRQMAGKLERSVENHQNLQLEARLADQSQKCSERRQFINDVVDFYLGDYRVVESFDVDGDSEAIESVWVDLQLEGSRESFSDYKEIFAQMRAKKCRLAIVRGQPGSGKTTLAKKIAYDWAKEEKKEIFDLILAVPLRDVQSKSDLLEMAVGFYLDSDDDIRRICADLKREKLKILIILDGLDEFRATPDSPLSKIFGSGLKGVNRSTGRPAKFDFDLLVTARPISCQLIHSNIMALKYKLVGLSKEKQLELVTKRCRKQEGKAKAVEYFMQSNCVREICQNPFLLSLVCFLSDMSESIPATITQLYDSFVHRMLIRAAEKDAIGEDFDPSNWQQSDLLKHLGSLALFGLILGQLHFTQKEMEICQVATKYFHSGLLQYRTDPIGLALKCDFLHGTVQEFLAAFYAVYFWGDKTLKDATGWPDDIWPSEFADLIPQMKVGLLIARECQTDSQFCRFYMGLLSGQHQFADSCEAVLDEIMSFVPCPLNFLFFFGVEMLDCSDKDSFTAGRLCNDRIDLINDLRVPAAGDIRKVKNIFATKKSL